LLVSSAVLHPPLAVGHTLRLGSKFLLTFRKVGLERPQLPLPLGTLGPVRRIRRIDRLQNSRELSLGRYTLLHSLGLVNGIGNGIQSRPGTGKMFSHVAAPFVTTRRNSSNK
jgi:hypothetical protein